MLSNKKLEKTKIIIILCERFEALAAESQQENTTWHWSSQKPPNEKADHGNEMTRQTRRVDKVIPTYPLTTISPVHLDYRTQYLQVAH